MKFFRIHIPGVPNKLTYQKYSSREEAERVLEVLKQEAQLLVKRKHFHYLKMITALKKAKIELVLGTQPSLITYYCIVETCENTTSVFRVFTNEDKAIKYYTELTENTTRNFKIITTKLRF